MRRGIAAVALSVILLGAAVSAWADAPVPGAPVVPIVVSGAVQSPYLAPFALLDSFDAHYGQLYTFTLKPNSWQDTGLQPGQAGLVDLGDGSARDQIEGTVSNSLVIGDLVIEMPGTKIALLRQGMDGRINPSGYGSTRYSQWIADGCPADARMIVCPVIHQAPMYGTAPQVVGFTGFYVDSYSFGTSSYSFTGAFTYLPEGAVAVPEPSTLLALSSLAFGALALRRRRV
jgi:hypothetical protein